MDTTSHILISGATGLIGTHLIEKLVAKGYNNISILTRSIKPSLAFKIPIQQIIWDPQSLSIKPQTLKDIDVVFNLVGENIADGLWTVNKKKRILDSRVNCTKLIISSLANQSHTPSKFISSSAIGIYGNCGDTDLNETSNVGVGYLADVCQQWEQSALDHDISGMTSYCIRTGLVLSNQGGALQKMLTPFKMGLGGPLASGQQFMSWIHIDDLVNQFIYVMENKCKNQIYNAVSPNPVTNLEFSKTLANHLKRPCIFTVPKFILKTFLGELSQILLDSQKVHPLYFEQEEFVFKYKQLKDAFCELL